MATKIVRQIYVKTAEMLSPDSIYYHRQIARQRNKKQTSEERKISTSVLVLHLYCLLMITRYTLGSLFMHFDSKDTYFALDIGLEVVNRKSASFDKIAFAFSAWLVCYPMAVYYIRYIRTDYRILQHQTELMNGCCSQFWRQYPQYAVNFNTRNICKVGVLLVIRWLQIRRQMAQFPPDKIHFKAQIVLLTLTIEMRNILFFILFKLITLLGVLSFTLFSIKTRPNYSPLQHAFIFIDRFGLYTLSSFGLNNLNRGAYQHQLFGYAYASQFNLLSSKLAKVVGQLRRRGTTTTTTLAAVLRNLLQHSHLVAFISHLNHQVIARELFIFLLLSLPYNIYLLTQIVFGIPPHTLVLIITTVQLSAASVSSTAALRLNKSLHFSAKYLPAIQLGASSRTPPIRDKFKILIYYEQLSCLNSKLGYTAGPLGIITPKSTSSAVVSYLIYFLFFCSVIQKNT